MNKTYNADEWFTNDIQFLKDPTIKEIYKTGYLRGMTEMYMHPPRAHWILSYPVTDYVNLYICSKCGESDKHAKNFKVSYCWNCGAKMDG